MVETPQAHAAAARKPVPAKAAPAKATPAKPAPAPASPELLSAIRAQARSATGRIYAERGYRPLWIASGRIGPAADALLQAIDSAYLDSLSPSTYKPENLRALIAAAKGGTPDDLARAELALSDALGRYVKDMRKPPRVEMIYADARLKPRKLKQDAALRMAAIQQPFSTYVMSMGWMSPHYVRMRALLATAIQNGADRDTLARLRLNRERTRLLPGPWVHHIVVDAASGRLWFYDGGKQQGTMKVVVGATETQTPMMAGMVNWAILNPYWNVPDYLAQKKVAPKVLGGQSLKSLNMQVLSDWSENARVLDPRSIDWQAVASGSLVPRIRELPGPANSMGRVKFIFPNEEGIYLHDTPARNLFSKTDRHFSNGCIRLEDAGRLGQWLLGKPLPPRTAKKPEQPIALPVAVPVYATYLTATDAKGRVTFLDDVYGRDSKAN